LLRDLHRIFAWLSRRMRLGVDRDCAIADDEDKQTENYYAETMGNGNYVKTH